MKFLSVALCALSFLGLAQARPVVIEEVATLTRPDASWEYFGRFGVAIDGDFALVSGERFVDGPNGGRRHEGAAFLYQRSGARWNHVGRLGPVALITAGTPPGLAMKDGVAVTLIDASGRVFERAGTTWTFTSFIDSDLRGPDIEIDAGRVLIQANVCSSSSFLVRDAGNLWLEETLLQGSSNFCPLHPPVFQDIQGGYALLFNPPGPNNELGFARGYVLQPDGSWPNTTGIGRSNINDEVFGPEVALAGPYAAFIGTRKQGTLIAHESMGIAFGNWSRYGLQPVDGHLQPHAYSATTLERAGSLFAQRNYSFDRQAYVINLFRVNDGPAYTSTHVATLQTRQGTSVGTSIDASGSRIIVSGRTSDGGDNVVRVYEVPAGFEQPAVQSHDFESPSAGAVWQPGAGSSFSIVRVDGTGVYRQASTDGQPSSWLPTSNARNQAIQAEVAIRAVAGDDRWAGLLTRRVDDSNYYYVTLRASGTVQLRRMFGGAFSTLASAPTTVVTGRKYRLRLESIGTVHRVYLDDRLVLAARDAAIAAGNVGIMMYRASADYDNVVVTPSPFTTIYTQDFSTADTGSWTARQGRWQATGGVFRQTNSAGYGRAYAGTATDDEIVQARIRPTSFVGPDNWVGLMARYRDDDNYLYVSLRARGVISLWRRTNGVITQLATRPLTVTAGTWYAVRMEVVDDRTRVYVNDQLMLSSSMDPGPASPDGLEGHGHVGLITYRATADFDDFAAYQP